MDQNTNPTPYEYPPVPPTEPTPPTPPPKKRMSAWKWVAIFVPIGLAIMAVLGVLTIKGFLGFVNNTMDQIAESEQYKLAIDYLKESESFQAIEPEVTNVKLVGWNYVTSLNNGQNRKKYELTFQTERATYTVIVRENENGFYVSESECYYNRNLENRSQLVTV